MEKKQEKIVISPIRSRLSGKISMFFNDLYNGYNLDDLGARNSIYLEKFQPVGLEFDWNKEGGSQLVIYCLPRSFTTKKSDERLHLSAFVIADFTVQQFVGLFDTIKIQAHCEFKPEANVVFADIFSDQSDPQFFY